jgi:hypothetical protein
MDTQRPVWRMVLCLRQFQNPDRDNRPYPGNMLNITLPGSPGIVVFQDHDRGHYKKKNSHTCNDAMKIQTSKSR